MQGKYDASPYCEPWLGKVANGYGCAAASAVQGFKERTFWDRCAMQSPEHAATNPSRSARLQATENRPYRKPWSAASVAIFILSLLFFVTGVLAGIMYRRLDADPVWIMLLVPFSFGMTGALVLFHFLNSSARIENGAYKVGGAAAGFIVLFGSFYHLTRQPFLDEVEWYQINNSALSSRMKSMMEAYNKVQTWHNSSINDVADSSIKDLNSQLWRLASGTYEVSADELWKHLQPLIKGAEKKYYATQYVLPETFWRQYWSTAYFQLNIEAAKRNVDLVRIFIIDPKDGQEQIITDLIQRHLENGLNIRIIDKRLLHKTFKSEDLNDILIVDDKIAGILLLEKGGGFNKVQFSVDPHTIAIRNDNFERLRGVSMSFEDWKAALTKEGFAK
jgi:hypothetical protein